MKKIISFVGCALLAGLGSASAQLDSPLVGGRVIIGPYFDAAHKLMFAQHDNIYGTSRTAAMGGAFTSLGADLSSMNINPAGLGMYQSSDWGVTQALSINTSGTGAPRMGYGSLTSGGSRTSYGLNNVAIAFNVFNRSSGLTSLTLGFSFNRAANFNSRSFINTSGEDTSISTLFQEQLQFMVDDGLMREDFDTSSDPFENLDIRLEEWGAVLGYQSGLVGDDLMSNATGPTDTYFQSVTKGGIYDYNFSAGMNISNFLYLGATLDLSEIRYTEDTSYEEAYPAGSTNIGGMWYDQSTRMDGSGFSLKFGAIARPLPTLRVGVAFHLPTYYTIEKSYESAMSAGRTGTATTYHANFTEDPKPRFNTAPKLLAGISYVIADKAILAVDYERTWYNKMHIRDNNSREIEGSKQESAALYKPANSFRAGLEILATDRVSLRAGGAYMMDFMRDKHALTHNPTVKSSWSLSGGAGFDIGRNGYIDLSYTYQRAKYTDYDLFYGEFYYDDRTDFIHQSDTLGDEVFTRYYTPRKNLHQITLTFGSRF